MILYLDAEHLHLRLGLEEKRREGICAIEAPQHSLELADLHGPSPQSSRRLWAIQLRTVAWLMGGSRRSHSLNFRWLPCNQQELNHRSR